VNKNKHTRGPWVVHEYKHGDSHRYVLSAHPDENGHIVCRIEADGSDMDCGGHDASLIAAAPRLLKSLEWALDTMAARKPVWTEGEKYMEARYAIAEALGAA